jgi:hypothetical protein
VYMVHVPRDRAATSPRERVIKADLGIGSVCGWTEGDGGERTAPKFQYARAGLRARSGLVSENLGPADISRPRHALLRPRPDRGMGADSRAGLRRLGAGSPSTPRLNSGRHYAREHFILPRAPFRASSYAPLPKCPGIVVRALARYYYCRENCRHSDFTLAFLPNAPTIDAIVRGRANCLDRAKKSQSLSFTTSNTIASAIRASHNISSRFPYLRFSAEYRDAVLSTRRRPVVQ